MHGCVGLTRRGPDPGLCPSTWRALLWQGTVSNQAAVFPGIQTLRLGLGLGVRDGGLHQQERRAAFEEAMWEAREGRLSLLCLATPLPTWPRAVVCRERGGVPNTSARTALTQTPPQGDGQDVKVSMVRPDSGTQASQPMETP